MLRYHNKTMIDMMSKDPLRQNVRSNTMQYNTHTDPHWSGTLENLQATSWTNTTYASKTLFPHIR